VVAHESRGVDPNPKLEVVGTVQVVPAANPAHDQMAAEQLAALRALIESGPIETADLRGSK
jgi:hypothetical protein